MFCDLVDSTSLAQHLDAEALSDLIDVYVETCDAVLRRWGGHLAQRMGDGLMAYFGWPSAHEDDPVRALHAALEIVRTVAGLRGSAREVQAVRVGVATGPAAFRRVGQGGRETWLAVGETPTLAARLSDLADVNGILVAEATRTFVARRFQFDDVGLVALKGFDGPRRVWRLVASSPHSDRPPRRPLVGRRDNVATLVGEWHRARQGEGRFVLLSGEPGIGKSRLVEALTEVTGHEPRVTLRYQCSPYHVNSALYPVIERISLEAGFARDDTPGQRLDKMELLGHVRHSGDPESAPLLAALLSLPIDRYPSLNLSAQQQKERTLELLLDYVARRSRTQPVLMIVEDLHWIDPTSQELLDLLVPRMAALPIMLVATYRLHDYAPQWSSCPYVTSVSLSALDRRHSVELARDVARGLSLSDDVIGQIVTRADGVPLYIEELTKSVLGGALPDVPGSLSGLLMARLDRLPLAREVAQVGACIGRVFSHDLLAEVSGQNPSDLDEALNQLTHSELVFQQHTPLGVAYTFKHALVQDAAYGSLFNATRQQVHRRVAEALERSAPGSYEPELLARHWTNAGDAYLRKAIPLWRTAGEGALARVALQEAVAHLQQGLALVEKLEPSPERESLELSIREPLHSARLRWRGWASHEVGVNAQALLELSERQNRPGSLLVGLWGKWINTITKGRVAESPAWATRLLDESSGGATLDRRILGYRSWLSSHFYSGELRQALVAGERALALYDLQHARRWMELTGNDVRTAAGVFMSQALWMLGYPDQAARLSDRKDEDARRLGHPFDMSWSLTWGTYVFDYRGEAERLLTRAEEAERLGLEQSIPVVNRVLVPVTRGLAFRRLGRYPEAIACLEQGIQGWRGAGGGLNVPYWQSALAEAHVGHGALDLGLRLVSECLEQIERRGWHEMVWLPEVLRLKGWMLAQHGQRDEAETVLQQSLDSARRQEARSWELRTATTLARLLVQRGDRESARACLAPVYDWFTEGFDTHDLRAARALLDALCDDVPATPRRS